MRWTCPHCQTELATVTPQHARAWHYARCSQCGGYSMVEHATGRSMKIETAAPPTPAEHQAKAPDASRVSRLRRRIALLAGGAALIAVALGLALSREAAPPSSPGLASAPAQPALPTQALALESLPLLASDTLHASAMAPARQSEPGPASAPAPLLNARLRHRALSDELRSGPGREYPVIGKARPGQSYPVVEWNNDKWFRVSVSSGSGTGTGEQTAWIHYDALELFTPERPKSAPIPTAPIRSDRP